MIYRGKDYADLLHLHLEKFQQGDDTCGIKIGVPSIDTYLESIKKGDLGFILGRPGAMKSSLLLTMTMNASNIYLANKKIFAPPVYVTKETSVEDLSLKILSNYSGIDTRIIRDRKVVNWDNLHQSVDEMVKEIPIVFIGHSLYDDVQRKHLDYDTIENEIKDVHDEFGKPSVLICADYLQRFNLKGKDDQSAMYSLMIDRSKDFALEEHTAWLWGCQAGRQVDERPFPIPLSGDGQWTSNIEQSADWMVSGMRPCKIPGWKVGEVVPKSKDNIIITKELFCLMVLKQKNGDAGNVFWTSFDPRIIEIAERKIDIH